jgi:hypothetical protein
MEATCSSEVSVEFQRTARRYIPEDRPFRNHRCENLKSYKIFTYSPLIIFSLILQTLHLNIKQLKNEP